MDPRFVYDESPSWRIGTKQLLHGYDYEELKPTKPVEEAPKQVEFELMGNNPILFGNDIKSYISGRFEKKAQRGAAVENV